MFIKQAILLGNFFEMLVTTYQVCDVTGNPIG